MLKRCLFCTKSKVEDMVSGGELINHSETFRVAHATSREEVAASMGFTLLHILYKNREEVVKRSALSCKL